MGRETEVKNNFRQSIGAGLNSLMNPKGRTYCILQHRTASQLHQPGQNQEIIVDFALLGRDSKAVVRFGDDLPMVSGEHAALLRQDNKWIIRHLSKVNETIVNGRPVNGQWFLQHGDEIQLANGGPRMGFLMPDNPSVGSIGLSRRLSLFREQALRPYKTAIAVMGVVVLLAIGGLTWWNFKTGKELVKTQVGLVESKEQIKVQQDSIAAIRKRNAELQVEMKKKLGEMSTSMASLRQQARDAAAAARRVQVAMQSSEGVGGKALPGELAAYIRDVYFLEVTKLTAKLDDGTEQSIDDVAWYGSGFLLNDGRFITARHVVEPWFFYKETDEALILLNILVNNGASISINITAHGPGGNKLYFTSSSFKMDRSSDIEDSKEVDGKPYTVRNANRNKSKDYAVAQQSGGSLQAAHGESGNLATGTVLTSLSYPETLGARTSRVEPHMFALTVSRSGLEDRVIMASGAGISPGSSGGPVLMRGADGTYRVVGIISAINGNGIDFIVPIDAVKR